MKYKEFREYLKINEIHTQEDKERIIAAYQYEISKIEERSIIFLISLVDVLCISLIFKYSLNSLYFIFSPPLSPVPIYHFL